MHGAKSVLRDIRVRNSIFTSEQNVRFSIADKRPILNQIHQELNRFFVEEFLPVIQYELRTKTNPKLLLMGVQAYLLEEKNAYAYLANFIEDASRYSNPPIEWKSENAHDRVDQFLEMFKDETDSNILSYHLIGSGGGQARGAFNSYVDLATDVFLRYFQKPSAKAVSLFYLENPDKLKTLAICKATFAMAALKGTVERLENLPEKFSRDDLVALYSGFIGTAHIMLSELKNLKSFIQDEEQIKKFLAIQDKIEMTIIRSIESQ